MRKVARTLVLNSLKKIAFGQITLHEKNNTSTFGESYGNSQHQAVVEIKNEKFYNTVLLGGDIGFAESYTTGEWRTDDLTKLLRIKISGGGPLVSPPTEAQHRKGKPS
jgi:cyclopropane-fatty-acyl-phospholipid synthase